MKKAVRDHSLRVKEEYETHLESRDIDSPEAAHWVGKEKTWLRFTMLTQIDSLSHKRCLDFGCGNGLLLDYLLENDIKCEYHGWDISDKMIDVCKQRHPGYNFQCIDVLEEGMESFHGEFDYIFISGVFHIKVDGSVSIHKEWIKEILSILWPICNQGISVNFLSEYVDWREQDLFYCDIDEMLRFTVETLSRHVVIRHDYPLFEFTLYIYKDPKVRL